MNQTLEQRRAAHAWQAVQAMKDRQGAEKYREQAKKLPARIMTAGLGQALAFLAAKGYSSELLEDIGDWVLDKRPSQSSKKPKPPTDALIRRIIESDSEYLRQATAESLAYLQWLVRFADAAGLTEEESRDGSRPAE